MTQMASNQGDPSDDSGGEVTRSSMKLIATESVLRKPSPRHKAGGAMTREVLLYRTAMELTPSIYFL